MQTFKDIKLKQSYDSDRDNIVESFYIPALSVATKYSRLAGFFSSSSLYIAARGIATFIKNGGKMRIIVGANLRKGDVEAILEATESPEAVISKMALEDLSGIEDKIVSNHVKALGWMVAKNMLEIKVAILLDKDGKPMPYEEAAKPGIFHQKVGVLEDAEGNMLSFSGSVNETATGWSENVEEFKTFRGWVESEYEYLKADSAKFEKYWAGLSNRIRVMDLPLAVKERLIEMAPSTIDDLDLERANAPRREKKLRDYQKEAIEKWLDNGKVGIFEMATGTGKTFTAISCVKRVLEASQKTLIVITCPYIHLVNQWSDEISSLGITTVKAFGSTSAWGPTALGYVLDMNNDRMESLILITTHDTFSSDGFMNVVNRSRAKTVLVADEMHGLGSPERQRGLMERYDYRLGLSATPKRWLDEEGTERIYSFFGKVVFEFSLKDAIEKINPDTDESYLTPYEYKPLFVGLTFDELEEYQKETRKIAKAYGAGSRSSERESLWQLFCILRQRIVVNASEKYAALGTILGELGGFSHCLVYCSPQQIQQIQEMLNKRGIVQTKFTAEENADERARIISAFAGGSYKALVAMKCLDEGVDIPPARYAILMANSGNPREFASIRGF